jgi:PAS domain S-box-containing protein
MQKDNKLYRILVVEDNIGDFVLVEEYLEEIISDLNIYRTENFKETNEVLTNNQKVFDVILLDISLPDKSGEQLISEMMDIAGHVPIIVLTGYSDAKFAIKSLKMGVADYLLKDEMNPTILHKSIVYNIERNKNIVRLQESEQRYADLFQLSPQPMWVFDMETLAFLNVNQAAIQHYGYSLEEFMQMTIMNIRPVEEWKFTEKILDSIRYENTSHLKYILNHIKKDGTKIRVEVLSNAIDFQGRKCRIILANDITAKLKYLEAIETQNEKLRDIAWIQSHILRAPLSRMMGLIEMIKREDLELSEIKEYLVHIINSAYELDEIIKDVVDKAQQISFQDASKPN